MSKEIEDAEFEEMYQRFEEEEKVRRQQQEQLREGFDGVMGNTIYEQAQLAEAVQRAKECAEELEEIAKRFQENDSIQPNATQTQYVLSIFYRMAGLDMDFIINCARRKDGFCIGSKLAIDNDTVKSLKASWEIVKDKLQDVFELQYDTKDTEYAKHYLATEGSVCGLVDDLLDNKSGNVDYEFAMINQKVYASYYGKSERGTETEGNNER